MKVSSGIKGDFSFMTHSLEGAPGGLYQDSGIYWGLQVLLAYPFPLIHSVPATQAFFPPLKYSVTIFISGLCCSSFHRECFCPTPSWTTSLSSFSSPLKVPFQGQPCPSTSVKGILSSSPLYPIALFDVLCRTYSRLRDHFLGSLAADNTDPIPM